MSNIEAFKNLLYSARTFKDDIIVIYADDDVLLDDTLLKAFAEDVSCLKQLGVKPIIIHGGTGPLKQIYQDLQFDHDATNGMRIVNRKSINIAEMILSGYLNKRLVSAFNNAGCTAIGISGKDANFIEATQLRKTNTILKNNIESIADYMSQGDVSTINPDFLVAIEDNGITPIISPIAGTDKNQTIHLDALNTASAISSFLAPNKLIIIAHTPYATLSGICKDQVITFSKFTTLLKGPQTEDLQKLLDVCKDAFENNIEEVRVISPGSTHALLENMMQNKYFVLINN